MSVNATILLHALEASGINDSKVFSMWPGVVAHAVIPGCGEAEAGGLLETKQGNMVKPHLYEKYKN